MGIRALCVGDWVEASNIAIDCVIGNAMMLKRTPVGAKIHNIELYPGAGGVVCRAADTFCQMCSESLQTATLKLCSGKLRLFNAECVAAGGVVAGRELASTKLGKAGKSRWLARRPSVGGVAVSPVDRPRGGGEGKTSGGRHRVTPWGKPTKGRKTRDNKRTHELMVKPRRVR
ncbi:50S ribosomal subunit protein L2 [Candidatus Hodgkinia cicadicola]|nr:50S ribosomal subunit protein L2 [Candidatus Hodgkinia cicadicola]